MISVAALVAAGIGPTQARAFLDPIQQTCEQFDISTPKRQAAFVAQAAHESSLFVHLEEDLYYRNPVRILQIFSAFRADGNALLAEMKQADPRVPLDELQRRAWSQVGAPYCGNPEGLANRAYANRNGNGPESSGDGWRYRGRGLFQLTGRANYTAAALELHEPYIDQPDLVAHPADACLTAGWYWSRLRLNGLADQSDIDGITRAINGPAMAGEQTRRDLYRRALQAFL